MFCFAEREIERKVLVVSISVQLAFAVSLFVTLKSFLRAPGGVHLKWEAKDLLIVQLIF